VSLAVLNVTHVLTVLLVLLRLLIVAAHDLCFLLGVDKSFNAAEVLPQLLFESVSDEFACIELVGRKLDALGVAMAAASVESC